MTTKDLTTTQGEEDLAFSYQMVEGIAMPTNRAGLVPWEGHIAKLRQMKLRDDDVFICAYPKAGTHWIWEVLSMLLQGKAEYGNRPKEQLMMEFVDAHVLDEMPSPRLLNTHLPFSMLPVPELKARRVKVVHVYRNPKDTAVSYYYHLTTKFASLKVPGEAPDFKEYFDTYFSDKALFGNYFDYLQQMHEFTQNNPDVPVLHLSFEDMKKSPQNKIQQLAAFLGLQLSETLCRDIEEACSFRNMKTHDGCEARPFFRNQSDLSADTPIPVTKIKFFRKGEVGDWKNHLTVAMSERVDSLVTHRMAGLPFTLRFEP